MSYKRTFDTGRLDSPRFARLTPGARHTYLTLWFNKAAHMSGLYAVKLEELAIYTGYSVQQIREHFLELEAHPALAVYVPVSGVVWVCDMLEDQGRGEKVGKGVEYQIAQLYKNCGLPRHILADFLARYAEPMKLDGEWCRLRYGSDTLSIPYRSPSDALSIPAVDLATAGATGSAGATGLALDSGSELQVQAQSRARGVGEEPRSDQGKQPLLLPLPAPAAGEVLTLAAFLSTLAEASGGRVQISHKTGRRELRNGAAEVLTLGLPQLLYDQLRAELQREAPDLDLVRKAGALLAAREQRGQRFVFWGQWVVVTADNLKGRLHELLTAAAALATAPAAAEAPAVTAEPNTPEYYAQIRAASEAKYGRR